MATDELRTVSEVAALSGVTVRALHHYDEIGLLTPTGRTSAGYRLYSAADLDRLTQIVAYRACDIGLKDIALLLTSAETEREGHLRRQIRMLDDRMSDLAGKRGILMRALEGRAMGINLDPEEILEVFGSHDPQEHIEEAEERWGETESYAVSHHRTASYTKEDWLRARADAEAVVEDFRDCMARCLAPGSMAAKAAAERHRAHIDRWYYPCSYEMQVGLADMYLADPRFTAYYDDRQPGLAAYVNAAITANAVDRA